MTENGAAVTGFLSDPWFTISATLSLTVGSPEAWLAIIIGTCLAVGTLRAILSVMETNPSHG